MDRRQTAIECAEIESSGFSVREYLQDCGCISPWGTWYRLQREELHRQTWQIRDGKGGDDMRKLTLADKKKAVDIAMAGGSPLKYLKELDVKNPSACWAYIKKCLKARDPEQYARLTAKETEEPEEEKQPEVNVTIRSEDIQTGEADLQPTIVKMQNMDGFEITGLKTTYGEWHVSNNGYLFFGANSHDELEMPVEVWRKFAADLPRVMQILGIA